MRKTSPDTQAEALLDDALRRFRAQQEQIDAARQWCEAALQHSALRPAGTPAEERAFRRGALKGRAMLAFDVLMALGVVPGEERE